ncbi:MAG: class I tRNA ligase family protein, partial [Patescibacteria group bacterium]
MKSKYLPKNFEKKWIEKWEKDKVYKTTDNKDKSYILDMFPYPSGGGLHVGHARIYTASDVLARFYRLKGKSVLHPMGWDAFGLPAENAAIKAKKNPIDMVPKNIESFKKQMQSLGLSYDWDREFATTDPSYYKWTQWLFIQFFKSGLLFKKSTPVYYCEFCKTGLAEEEVVGEGKHERCGNEITRKTLPQWIFRITLYADELLDGIDDVDWPEGIKKMQKNWIGKSEGMEINFKIKSQKSKVKNIKVFTTRQDTVFGATALILAPEHELIDEILKNNDIKLDADRELIRTYVEEAKKKLDLARTDLNKEKTGVFSGLYAENPVNNEKIPIWIADYIVGWYGYGAVMFVPDGDLRDFEFAKKNNLPIKQVVNRKDLTKPFIKEGILIKNKEIEKFLEDKKVFDKPLTTQSFREIISEKIKERGFGQKIVQYK